jgi:hypothetical protein
MESQALKELVKKVHGDPQTKQEFLSNPSRILSQFDLTEAEVEAVLSAHARLALATPDAQLDTDADPLIAWM